MIHSMGGGVIKEYDSLTFAFVEIADGLSAGGKAWYISPFAKIKAGDRVQIPVGRQTCTGKVLKVTVATAQTAPYPINRTKEIECILQ